MYPLFEKKCYIFVTVIYEASKPPLIRKPNITFIMEAIQETIRQTGSSKIWEKNHQKIVECVQNLIKNNKEPSITNVSEKAGLSRPTIYKHLNEFEKDEAVTMDEKLMRLMHHTILLKICNQALNGDMKAAKLFTEITGARKTGRNINNHFINHRSNTIQFNGLVISEEILQSLPPEKRMLIEDIIKSVKGNK
jgi:DNA-binding phage protein